MILFPDYFPREKSGSCPPAKFPDDYYDDYYTRNVNPYRSSKFPNFVPSGSASSGCTGSWKPIHFDKGNRDLRV